MSTAQPSVSELLARIASATERTEAQARKQTYWLRLIALMVVTIASLAWPHDAMPLPLLATGIYALGAFAVDEQRRHSEHLKARGFTKEAQER